MEFFYNKKLELSKSIFGSCTWLVTGKSQALHSEEEFYNFG